MFDKNKFAQIIKNIKETYNSQEEFSKKSGIGRTYLSQYMNMKLDEPPKPKILEKLANASNDIISYNELMNICGYTDANSLYKIFLEDNLKQTEDYYLKKLNSVKLNPQEEEVFQDMDSILSNKIHENMPINEVKAIIYNHFENIDFLSESSKQKVINQLLLFTEYCNETLLLRKKIANANHSKKHIKQKNLYINQSSMTSFYMCPVYRSNLS